MDLNYKNAFLVAACVLRKLKRIVFHLIDFLQDVFELTQCVYVFLNQQRLEATEMIKSSPHLRAVLLCCFIILFPLTCLLLGLYISTYLSPSVYVFPSKDVVVDPARCNFSYFKTQNLTVNMVGRLGNRMFQYAALYGIASANGFIPVVFHDEILTRTFNKLKCKTETNAYEIQKLKSKSLTFVERRSNAFDQHSFMLNFEKCISLVGFYQSWRYFDHVRPEIRQQFESFVDVEKVDHFLKQVISKYDTQLQGVGDVVLVGIHVRRGDFITESNKGYSSPDKYYFKRAMEVFTRKYTRLVFIVCSDEIQWAKNNIKGSSVVYSPFTEAHHDLRLLAFCHHSIISGGSFGWWGAWLADGTTVYPENFPTPGSSLASQFRRDDYFLPQWTSV